MAAVFVATHFAGRLRCGPADTGDGGSRPDRGACGLVRRGGPVPPPLGLPIPHTALLPRNQTRAARNVGRFLETHFLDPPRSPAGSGSAEPARRAIEWLARPDSAALVARELVGLLGGLLTTSPPRARLRGRVAWLRTQVRGAGSRMET